MKYRSGEVLAKQAWELRANFRICVASYVALAERIGAVLLTGDQWIPNAGDTRG